MHNLVVLGEGAEDVLLLCALLLKALLGVLDIVFLLLRDLLGLLAALALMQGSKASLQTLHLADNRLQLVSTSGVLALHDALDEGVVAVEHNVVSVGHLCVEGHACLVAAHLLHTTHILALGDDDRQRLLAQRLNLNIELGLVHFWHLGAEHL